MKNLKKVLSCLVTGIFAISCTKIDNVFNGNKDSNRFGIPTENVNFKISNEPIVPKILTFESKVPIKPLKLLKKLPEGRNFDFRFEVNPKKLKKNIIKISENGDFKLTIKKGNKFSVIDNNATDGNATIEIPENVINSFIGIPEKDEDEHRKVTGSINIEDKLYYAKQEIKPLSKKELEAIFDKDEKEHDKKFETKKENTEKDKENNEGWYTGEREDGTWYQIGKRPLPIPSEWKSDDGIDYVLSFKNQGIKQFDFKGYKVNNPKDYEYPDGINLIGIKGGTVSLTGVGKIEIPQGALDKEIFISMKQELQGMDFTIPADECCYSSWDYIAPIVKLEPFNLELKKKAKITLKIDTNRLGNNDPSQVIYFSGNSIRDIIPRGNYVNSKIDGDNIPPNEIVSKYITILNNISALIDSRSTPTSEAGKPFTLEELIDEYKKSKGYKINAIDPVLLVYQEFANEFISNGEAFLGNFKYIKTSLSKLNYSDMIVLGIRMEKAYYYYKNDLNYNPPNKILYDDIKDNSYIPVKIENYFSQKPDVSVVGLNGYLNPTGDTMFLPDYKSIEHEVFHLFQHKILISNSGSYDFANSKGIYKWVEESTAEYMGAKTYKNFSDAYSSKNSNMKLYYPYESDIKDSYSANISDGLLDLFSTKKIPYSNNYHEVPFFTYLADKNSKKVGIIKEIFENKKPYLENFPDYTLHTLLNDILYIYPSSMKIAPSNTLIKDQNRDEILGSKNPEIVLSTKENLQKTFVTLENNSAKYLFFRSNYNKKNPTLGITVKTKDYGCETTGTTKIRVLFYDTSGNNTMVLPQYLDPNSGTEEIDSKYSDMFTEKKALNLKTGQIYPFLNFGEDFSKAVLIISNSNGQLGNGNTCNYEVESCLLCFK